MLLSDVDIAEVGPGIISPFDPSKVQPASYDLSIGTELLVPILSAYPATIDLRVSDPGELLRSIVMEDEGYILGPGQVALANTVEYVRCPDDIAIRVEGKSSLARLFLLPHVAAGWIDPGFWGQITLELVNLGPWGVRLYPGMPIAQMNMTRMSTPVARPYGSEGLGSHYAGQTGPMASVGKRSL